MPSPPTRRRRSARIAEERRIEVAGTNINGIAFLADSRTLVLSRHGAKIYLEQGLDLDQHINIYDPKTGLKCPAKVVGLYDRDSKGYSYGIEFLYPSLNFWNLAFPSGAEAAAAQPPAKTSVTNPQESTAQHSPKSPAMESAETRRLAVRSDYAVQMRCPHGGEVSWLLLRSREESIEQVLNTPWDFPCRAHGPQRELPMQVRPAQQWLQSQVWGESYEPQRQSEIRSARAVRVWVSGVDTNGNPFSQSAYSVDISRNGARLDGVGFLTAPGKIIEVKRGWKKARFRVVWVGQRGGDLAGQVGIRCLEPEKDIWNLF